MTELFERVLNTDSFAGMSKETLIDALHEFKNTWNENQDVIFKLRENWRNAESDLSTTQFKKDKLKDDLKQVIAEGKIIEDASEYWKEEYTHVSQSRDFYEGKWKECKKELETALDRLEKKDKELLGLEEHVNYLHKIHYAKETALIKGQQELKKKLNEIDNGRLDDEDYNKTQ